MISPCSLAYLSSPEENLIQIQTSHDPLEQVERRYPTTRARQMLQCWLVASSPPPSVGFVKHSNHSTILVMVAVSMLWYKELKFALIVHLSGMPARKNLFKNMLAELR